MKVIDLLNKVASVFMNKNKGYVSGQMRNKKFENSNYKWEVL